MLDTGSAKRPVVIPPPSRYPPENQNMEPAGYPAISNPPPLKGTVGDIEAGFGERAPLYPYIAPDENAMRWAFIRKVYVSLSMQLILTVITAGVVAFYHPVSSFLVRTPGLIIGMAFLPFLLIDTIREVWNALWNWFHKPIHAVAHILHPLWRGPHQLGNDELDSGFEEYVERWTDGDIDMQTRIEDEMLVYRNHRGKFGKPTALLHESHLKPVSWWEKYGDITPILKQLALLVLSQDCGAGPCERNWSTWSLFHTKKEEQTHHETG